MFQHWKVIIYSVEGSQDAPTMLGVRYEKLYRLVGQTMIGSNEFLKLDLDLDLNLEEDTDSLASSSPVREGDP